MLVELTEALRSYLRALDVSREPTPIPTSPNDPDPSTVRRQRKAVLDSAERKLRGLLEGDDAD